MSQSDAQKLRELLVENGREHLQVMSEEGSLVVCSLSEKGEKERHFRLTPLSKGYQVAFWDKTDWRKAPITGTLEKCVDQLVSSSASRMAP